MGKDSKIEWTHHTFNPWWGCMKISPACTNCYAEAFAKRTGNKVWGFDARRRFFGEPHWADPVKWNRDAQAAGERRRVFCASMADVCERLPQGHPDAGAMFAARHRLMLLIEATPWLDWLLLTKRPHEFDLLGFWTNADRHKRGGWPQNAWAGTTVESKAYLGRVEDLVRVPAPIRFLSCEPLLGPLDLRPYLSECDGIDLVIVGGESGHGARPMNPAWARDLRDQCTAAGCAFFFKQWGDYDDAGVRVGKKAAGRLLDGQEWNELPIPTQPKGVESHAGVKS